MEQKFKHPNNHIGTIKVDGLSPEEMRKVIMNEFDLSLEQIIKKKGAKGNRKPELVTPRKILSYLLYRIHKDNYTLNVLGSYIGYDHSLLYYHAKDCSGRMEVDKAFREMVHAIQFKCATGELIKTKNYTVKDAINHPKILKHFPTKNAARE